MRWVKQEEGMRRIVTYRGILQEDLKERAHLKD
jgi:hypothetical protein